MSFCLQQIKRKEHLHNINRRTGDTLQDYRNLRKASFNGANNQGCSKKKENKDIHEDSPKQHQKSLSSSSQMQGVEASEQAPLQLPLMCVQHLLRKC